jgi:predicted nucleic acid-binding protein
VTLAGISLDTGALIAIARGDVRVIDVLDQALRAGVEVHIVPGVLAQAWRGGARQARLSRLVHADGVQVVVMDEEVALAVGELCGRSRHADIVDVHVVLHAREHGHRVMTSDPDDLRRVDPALSLIVI